MVPAYEDEDMELRMEDALINGKIVGKWPDPDGEKLAIVGERFNGDVIKVVIKDTEIPKVITVCYPYENYD